jgi:hypothetical protein
VSCNRSLLHDTGSLTDLEGHGFLEQPEALKMRQRKAEP